MRSALFRLGCSTISTKNGKTFFLKHFGVFLPRRMTERGFTHMHQVLGRKICYGHLPLSVLLRFNMLLNSLKKMHKNIFFKSRNKKKITNYLHYSIALAISIV